MLTSKEPIASEQNRAPCSTILTNKKVLGYFFTHSLRDMSAISSQSMFVKILRFGYAAMNFMPGVQPVSFSYKKRTSCLKFEDMIKQTLTSQNI